MNRAYKSVWNASLGAYVAVSEHVFSAGRKTSSSRQTSRAHLAPSGQFAAMALEPRVVFDGAMAVTFDFVADTGLDGLDHSAQSHLAEPVKPAEPATMVMPQATPTDQANSLSTVRVADAPAEAPTQVPTPRVEIVFVDAAAVDLIPFVDATRYHEVHVLSADRDGLTQMAELLAGRNAVDAVHIVSHGSSGALLLGSGTLDAASLAGAHSAPLATIAAALSADADLMLYGCDVASGEQGQAFISQLAAATGADVAASTDLTGAASTGADWVLEAHVGNVDAQALDAAGWSGTLDAVTLTPSQVFTGKGMSYAVIGNSELKEGEVSYIFDKVKAFVPTVPAGTATTANLSNALLPTGSNVEAVYLYLSLIHI